MIFEALVLCVGIVAGGVATATAIALAIDLARVPVYVATEANELLGQWTLVAGAAIGVTIGTLGGSRLLAWIRESTFRTVVSAIILTLGFGVLASLFTRPA